MHSQRDRVVIFLYWRHVEDAFRRMGTLPDVLALRDYLVGGRKLMKVFIYTEDHPDNEDEDAQFHAFLRREGFVVRTKQGRVLGEGPFQGRGDIWMALDAWVYADTDRPDVVVLGTGDGDFALLATWIRQMGIRVEVAATGATLDKELEEKADAFVDLGAAALGGAGSRRRQRE